MRKGPDAITRKVIVSINLISMFERMQILVRHTLYTKPLYASDRKLRLTEDKTGTRSSLLLDPI